MVDITQCAVCGKTIPATLDGCAYCDSERLLEPASHDYTPMLLRWLLILFVSTTILTATLALSSLAGAGSSEHPALRSGLAFLRVSLSAVAGFAVGRRLRWAFHAALLFVFIEIIAGSLHAFGLLPSDAWSVRVITPLWAVLFAVFFLRTDVQSHFDRSRRDRARVDSFLRSLDAERRGGQEPDRPKRR
jgi:hypothetical protein